LVTWFYAAVRQLMALADPRQSKRQPEQKYTEYDGVRGDEPAVIWSTPD
jgi:hypothetical protein